ncbi:hypothetical protein Chor_009615 [Crotalus horridus]
MWMWPMFIIIIIISLSRRSTGQSVDQTSGIVTVMEGQFVSLSSYEAQYSGMHYPFWYIQHPGQPLKILLTRFNKNAQGFQAGHYENDKKGTFNMQKQAIQLEDSAVYFCALTRSRGQSVDQTSGIVAATEGQPVVLYCSYEAQTIGSYYPYWYIQYPGQALKFLLGSYENNAPGFQATHHKDKKNGTFNLQKDSSQLKDSAAYFCAFSDTV